MKLRQESAYTMMFTDIMICNERREQVEPGAMEACTGEKRRGSR